MKKIQLLIKSLAGMAFLFCMMGATLFLPAGGFNYPLAWLYLIAFFVPVIMITIYTFVYDPSLLQSRLNTAVTEPRLIQKVITLLSGLCFFGTYIVAGFDKRHGWSELPNLVSYIALGMVFFAMMFVFKVFRQNKYLSANIEVQEGQKVISTGLYGIIRHPMYSGVLVMMFSTAPGLGSLWALLPVAGMSLGIVFRTIDEEKELKANLEGYAEYCEKVKYRIIPYIF